MTRPPCAILLVGLFLCLSVSSSAARTWYITVDGTGDAPTIQAAVDSAGMDDTILVAPGTYSWSNQGTGNEYGMIHIMRGAPALTIFSEAGPEMTILDGEMQGRVFFYQGHYPTEPGGLIIEGFTFIRGKPTQVGNLVGGGFTAHLSSPVIRNSVFRFCESEQGGAYWFGGQGSPQLVDCLFEDNTARYGGAVFAINTNQTVLISNCRLRRNTAGRHGGAIFGYNAPLWVENSVMAFNTAVEQGGGIAFQNCWPSTVTQCTLHKNSGPQGGGIAIVADTELSVDHTIVSNSLSGGSASIPATGSIVFSCSDLFGNVGGSWIAPFAGQNGIDGNFSSNALYCDTSPSTDLDIEAGSPCASGNHPNGAACGLVGARPVGCGGVPVEKRTWGGIKSMYAD
ncbi:MAG: right-handed parallel beta-helix repeat-containing protein [bacterium]